MTAAYTLILALSAIASLLGLRAAKDRTDALICLGLLLMFGLGAAVRGWR